MRYLNKKVLAGLSPILAAVVFSGCEDKGFSVEFPTKDLSLNFSFRQSHDENGLIGNLASVGIQSKAQQYNNIDYNEKSSDKIYVAFDDEKLLLVQDVIATIFPDSNTGGILDVFSTYGGLSFSHVQPAPGTLINALFERNGVNMPTGLSLALPEIITYSQPAAGTVYARGDEMVVVWDVVDNQPVGGIKFTATCNFLRDEKLVTGSIRSKSYKAVDGENKVVVSVDDFLSIFPGTITSTECNLTISARRSVALDSSDIESVFFTQNQKMTLSQTSEISAKITP